MNFMNRKLFKGRAARDKLNKMGGIMASSQPLINTVQRFKDGNTVRVPSRNPSIPSNRSLVVNPKLGTTGSQSVVPYQSPYQKFSRIKNALGVTPVGLLAGDVLNTAPLKTAEELSGVGEGKVQAYKPGEMTDLGINREQFDKLSEEDQLAYLQAENDARFAKRAGYTAGIGKFANVGDTLANTFETLTENSIVERAAKAAGLMDPTDSFESRNPKEFQQAREEGIAANRPLTIQQFRAALPSTEERAPRATTEEQYMAGPGAVAESLIGMSTAPPARGDADPEVEPEFQSEFTDTRRPTDGAARDKGAAGPVAQDQVFMNAAKSGELGAEKQVQAIMNEGTPQEVEKSLEQLMAEFTSSAPEYEGLDKGLAIAKIGFAMAAGQSPDAISNIATALQGGADMFIQDKSKRDAFSRQVQLSALQYGLGEQGKDRAARRQMQYKTTDYVLMPGETYTYPDGREITGGEDGTTISLNQSDILKNGLPGGVQGTALANSIIERRTAYDKAAAKAEADAIKGITVNDPKKITAFVTDYTEASDKAIQANNAMHLTKQVMMMNADGQITGFRPGFNSALAKAMAAAGVDATSYTDRDLAIADLRKVFQKLVPLTLGKDQSANSISDKDVDRLANAYMSAGILDGGILALMTTPANVLNSKLSGVLTEFENAEKSALAKLTSLEQTGQEFITPSGTTLGSRVSAQRDIVQEVFPQKGVRPMLSVRDDGTFFLPQ